MGIDSNFWFKKLRLKTLALKGTGKGLKALVGPLVNVCVCPSGCVSVNVDIC